MRLVVAMMLSLLGGIPSAFVEPYVGGHIGLATGTNSDFTQADFISSAGVLTDIDLPSEVGTSIDIGLRAGYWFDFLPLIGTQFDLYLFGPDVNFGPEDNIELFQFDISIVALGFSIMGRYPLLKQDDFPRGRLQPYLGLGPAIFITSWDDQESNPALNIGSDTVVNGGLQFLAGVSYFIRERVSAFAEYKFTHHVTQIGGLAEGQTFSIVGSQPFNVSHFTIGVNYHFY
jgi:hypothetical protein